MTRILISPKLTSMLIIALAVVSALVAGGFCDGGA
jgi:hypothetical protein